MNRNDKYPYRPITPLDRQIIDRGATAPPRREFGLYSRADIVVDEAELRERLLGQQPGATIEDFQYWAEGNWKTIHGTYDSTKRFGAKLKEEFDETRQAFRELNEAALQRGDSNQQLIDNFASELGDILWCMSALASNGGASLDAGMKTLLYNYVIGTQYIIAGEPHQPPWRPIAIELSTKWDKVTIDEIDNLVDAGFEPGSSTTMNIYDPHGEEYELEEHLEINLGSILLAAIQLQISGQYGRGATADEANATYVMQGLFETHAVRLAEMSASAIIEIAYLARKCLNMSLLEIIAKNVRKISYRVENDQVDKIDKKRDKQAL